MSSALRPTQTEGHSPRAGGTPSIVRTLTRFFRADHPFDEIASFALSQHPRWDLGRVDYCSPSASSPRPRIGTVGDMAMSGHHAILMSRGDTYQVEDAGSKNGTFVNGQRLLGTHILQHGDVIECGRSFFLYRSTTVTPMVTQLSTDALPAVVPLHYQIAPLLPYVDSNIGLSLHGETGTGKEIVALAVHALSSRRGGRFVAINCAAIPENLFESEMFGYRKGAFSGAVENHSGAMVQAHGGTLFLDEVAELPLSLQAKLLRVLETKEIVPLGGRGPVPADFRLVSATLADLRERVEAGCFRRDLFARLGQFIPVAPLRDHREELGTIIQLCLASPCATSPQQLRSAPRVCFTLEAARALVRYRWPCNIRELRQCIAASWMRAIADRKLNSETCVIDLCHLPPSVVDGSDLTDDLRASATISSTLAKPTAREPPLSDQQILEMLRKVDGNRAEAAKLLDVSERTIYRRLNRLRMSELPKTRTR